jgi:hypothetical protein
LRSDLRGNRLNGISNVPSRKTLRRFSSKLHLGGDHPEWYAVMAFPTAPDVLKISSAGGGA